MNDKLLYLIKSQGWRVASNMVGGPDVLFKLLDITPMKFLQSFNGLEQCSPLGHVTPYGYSPSYYLFLHDKIDNLCFFNYEEIWSLFEYGFKLTYRETQEITKQWLYESYNIDVVRTTRCGWN